MRPPVTLVRSVLHRAVPLLLGCLCLAGGSWEASSGGRIRRPGGLLDRARPIWGTHGNTTPHLWDRGGRPVLFEGNLTTKLTPVVIHPERHRRRRLPSITGADADELIPSSLATSRNGEWLLWSTAPTDEEDIWHVRRLYGGSVRRWRSPVNIPHLGAWLPDSSAWVEVRGKDGDGKLLVHPVAGAGEEIVAAIDGFEEPSHLLGVTRRRQALILLDHNLGGARLGTIGLPPEPVRATSFEVRFPFMHGLSELSLNGKRDQLAWVLNSPIDTQRYPNFDFWESLWLSNAHGKNMREIGRFASRYISREPSSELTDLSWTKDGRALSFEFQERLWILPVH